MDEGRLFPGRQQVAGEPASEDEVDRPFPEDLVGDRNLAATRVLHVRHVHETSLRYGPRLSSEYRQQAVRVTAGRWRSRTSFRLSLTWAGDYHDEISVSPGDLREQARGFEPGELLVELAGMIDLRVDRRYNIRGIDGLHDVCEDETAGRVEPAGDASEQIRLAVPSR